MLFRKLLRFFSENDNEQLTVNGLSEKMGEYADGDAYSFPKMKSELKNYFGNELIISELHGKANVVTFRRTASSILHNFNTQQIKDEDTQKKVIIETAAELIKSDIKAKAASRAVYPSHDEIASCSTNLDFVNESLRLFLMNIFSGKDTCLKVAAVGQAIMQAARRQILICPLEIGLAVQIHHCFGSKFLVDTLFSLGFSSSCNEVLTYEMNCALFENSIQCDASQHFTQYMAENIDHNTATLDGLDTFHGMCIIAAVTPAVNNKLLVIRRTDITLEELEDRAKN